MLSYVGALLGSSISYAAISCSLTMLMKLLSCYELGSSSEILTVLVYCFDEVFLLVTPDGFV